MAFDRLAVRDTGGGVAVMAEVTHSSSRRPSSSSTAGAVRSLVVHGAAGSPSWLKHIDMIGGRVKQRCNADSPI